MFGNIGDMMGKLQEMKRKSEEMKKKLDATVITVEGADGALNISVTGSRKIINIKISEVLQSGKKEELESQLMTTFNKAMETVNKLNEEEMKKAAGGLLPGM